jgi:hypothetical protein
MISELAFPIQGEIIGGNGQIKSASQCLRTTRTFKTSRLKDHKTKTFEGEIIHTSVIRFHLIISSTAIKGHPRQARFKMGSKFKAWWSEKSQLANLLTASPENLLNGNYQFRQGLIVGSVK